MCEDMSFIPSPEVLNVSVQLLQLEKVFQRIAINKCLSG